MVDRAPGAGLLVSADRRDDVTTIIVAGEVEHATARPLRTALGEVARERPRTLIIDLGDVTFIDSTGLSLLINAKERSVADHCRLLLRNPSDRVLRVLEVSGLTEMFEIEAQPL